MTTAKFIEWGSLALVWAMPFHALATIWLASRIGYFDQLRAWKELLIIAMVGAAGWVLWQTPKLRQRLNNPINIWIGAYLALSILASLFNRVAPGQLIAGLKVNFAFLVVFLVVQLVAKPRLTKQLERIILVTGLITATIAVLQALALPPDVLRHFGYSLANIDPVQTVADTSIYRYFATLSGPNQFGAFLVIPICLLASKPKQLRGKYLVGLLILLLALFLTQSRSAWMAALIGGSLTLWLTLPRRGRFILISTVIGAMIGLGLTMAVSVRSNPTLQYYLLHNQIEDLDNPRSSNSQHLSSAFEAVQIIKAYPAGSGLGTAGPASLVTGQPFYSENYYLQIAVEAGMAGLVAFLVIKFHLARTLLSQKKYGLIGAFAGISLINLLLHAWADSTTALVFWTSAGSALGSKS